MAGFNSMVYTYVAAFIGVLLAGALSDKWAIRDHAARMILQAIGLVGGSAFLFFMGVKTSVWLVYLMFAGWGFFRAFFDANTYSVLYDVTPERLHSSCSSAMIMTGRAETEHGKPFIDLPYPGRHLAFMRHSDVYLRQTTL